MKKTSLLNIASALWFCFLDQRHVRSHLPASKDEPCTPPHPHIGRESPNHWSADGNWFWPMAFEKTTCLMKNKNLPTEKNRNKIKRSFLRAKPQPHSMKALCIHFFFCPNTDTVISIVLPLPPLHLPKWKWRQMVVSEFILDEASCWASPRLLVSLKIWFPYPCTSLTGV